MKIIEFRDLYLADYNLRRFNAMNQHWANGREFSMKKARETSALLYLKDSRAEYILDSGEHLVFPRGSVIYIPQGSQYHSWFYACSSPTAQTQLIEFELTDWDGAPFVCSRQICAALSSGEVFTAFDEAVRIFQSFSVSYGELKAVLYGLLSKIAAHHQTKALNSKAFFPIAPAIRYLQKNPCTDVDVAQLAQMCHVSEGCFRSLFKKYFGKTPSKFCLDNRMQRATQLLQSNMYSVSEVAFLVGYTDPGYFTKVFKNETGKLPREYMKYPEID